MSLLFRLSPPKYRGGLGDFLKKSLLTFSGLTIARIDIHVYIDCTRTHGCCAVSLIPIYIWIDSNSVRI